MFRLRETLLFENLSLQVLVPSTRNTTLKKEVACRLRETPPFFENYALAYAKHYFSSAHLAGLGAVVSLRSRTIPKNICSRLRETLVFFENCALVYAKQHFFSARLASLGAGVPMRRLTTQKKV